MIRIFQGDPQNQSGALIRSRHSKVFTAAAQKHRRHIQTVKAAGHGGQNLQARENSSYGQKNLLIDSQRSRPCRPRRKHIGLSRSRQPLVRRVDHNMRRHRNTRSSIATTSLAMDTAVKADVRRVTAVDDNTGAIYIRSWPKSRRWFICSRRPR